MRVFVQLSTPDEKMSIAWSLLQLFST